MAGSKGHPHEDHRDLCSSGGLDGMGEAAQELARSGDALDYASLDVHDQQSDVCCVARHISRRSGRI
jgi:hypothetical protein